MFTGEFAGLRTDMDDYDSGDNGQTLRVLGSVIDSHGATVGSFHREYYRDEHGRLVARHEELKLAPEVQGNGFAREFNGHLESWYRRNGVDYISLRANIDVGGYAWARAGYDFSDQAGYEDVIGRLRDAVEDYETEADQAADPRHATSLRRQVAKAEALLERVDAAPRRQITPVEIAALGRPKGAGGHTARWIGRDALLGSAWEGVKWLR